jgi:hypothetical protein
MYGQSLFAVSLFPEPRIAVIFSGHDLPIERLKIFLNANHYLLSDPRICVGTWYDEANDLSYIDIVAVLPSRETAIALGKKYNQIAIYDLYRHEEIDTGGTGEFMELDTPPEDRLLPINR